MLTASVQGIAALRFRRWGEDLLTLLTQLLPAAQGDTLPAMAFDTHAAVKKLTDAGADETLAVAVVEVAREASMDYKAIRERTVRSLESVYRQYPLINNVERGTYVEHMIALALEELWKETSPPQRQADIYVFAWHPEEDLKIADHRRPDQWKFFVVAEEKLPRLPDPLPDPLPNTTIGLSGLTAAGAEHATYEALPAIVTKVRESLDSLKADQEGRSTTRVR